MTLSTEKQRSHMINYFKACVNVNMGNETTSYNLMNWLCFITDSPEPRYLTTAVVLKTSLETNRAS